MRFRSLVFPALLLILEWAGTVVAQLQILSAGDDGLRLELRLPDPWLTYVEVDGRPCARLHLKGAAHAGEAGQPDLPFLAELLAAPPGSRIEIDLEEATPVELEEIDLVPASGDAPAAPPPGTRVQVQPLGILRGVSTWALRLYPFEYDPIRRVLRAYPRLRFRLRFEGGRRPRAATLPDSPLYRAFLNADQVPSWVARPPAAKSQAESWYDPSLPWLKLHVEEDGLFRLDPLWLGQYLDPEGVDPRTFRLFYLGEEQPLYVRGQEDGRFDPDDYLLFYGRFRREARDFASLYGPRNTYWLTWGGVEGKRFAERSGAPVQGYPEQTFFWHTSHFEVDSPEDECYDPLNYAPDNNRDHWFWFRVDATHPTRPGSGIFSGELQDPDLSQEYLARLRVALHGATDLGHHTAIKLNTHFAVADTIWGGQGIGQVELLIDAQVPSSALEEEINRVTVLAFADQEKYDSIYMNWFEIGYRRQYQAVDGYLEFSQPPSAGHRIAVAGLRSQHVELFDVANGVRFTDLQFANAGGQIRLIFEDRHERPALYVVADTLAFKVPRGEFDVPSSWRQANHQAEYLIVFHPALAAAAEALATHRRNQGLEVEMASTADIYDEFSHGLVDREAIRDFLYCAYHYWEGPPTYVLLLGDDTYDYRGLKGAGVPTFVPTLYYQSRGRGHQPSDFLFSLVDGDDLLPDLAIGRLAASNRQEAWQSVEKIRRYDLEPEPGSWRNRVIYLANYHPKGIFTGPCDSLAARYTEPAGLTSVKVYNPDDSPIPNPTGKEFLEALNEGALLLHFNGHGSVGTLQFVLTLPRYRQLPEWDYLAQVRNRGRLPLVLAFSCLNGMFVNPTVESLGEVFTTLEGGGAIAFISASAKSFVSQNDLLSERLYAQFFEAGERAFGPTLNAAKAQLLAAHPGWEDVPLTLQLFGDPAQELALPRAPDYAAEQVQVESEPVFGHAVVPVRALLRNLGRLAADSLEVIVRGRGESESRAETLFAALLPPFAGPREFSFSWPVGQRRGPFRLELELDPADRIAEEDETNNRATLALEILEPLAAELIFPPSSAVVSPGDLRLEVLVPLEGGPFACQFALSPDPHFPPDRTQESPLLPADGGIAVYCPLEVGADHPYFWRVRLHTPRGVGPWSAPRSFLLSSVPAAGIWHQQGAQLLAGTPRDLVLVDGRLEIAAESLPFRPSASTREDGFTVRGLSGAGVLCTDGIYAYAKRWYNDSSTVYPGIDYFTRVGTGFNGTYRTANLGLLSDSTTAGISATYHRDGFIYSECGRAHQLERLSVATGRLDTVAVPDGLLEWKTGRVQDGHALITSDGRYLYNVSMSSPRGIRTEWSVRVFDPTAGWALVREFTSPPTETGFTFEWTDGILADGRRLYLIEYGGKHRIRMIDAFDGHFLDEWTSDQEETRIITGQYDWVNNKVWLGDLFASAIYRYTGLGQIDSASVVSEPIGPAAAWKGLRVAGATSGPGRLTVDLLIPEGESWAIHPDFADLPLGQEVELKAIDASTYPYLRLRARLAGGPGKASLESWTVDFQPRPSLRLVRAEGVLSSAGLQVQVALRNLSPFAVGDARLILEQSDRSGPLREQALPLLERGETYQVQLDSLALPPPGIRLYARLFTGQPDAIPEDNAQEVALLFGGRAPLTVHLWPENRPFLSGDPLRPDQGLVIASPNLADAHLSLSVDGAPVEADSLLDPFPLTGPRVLYRPRLAPGDHQLQVRLLRKSEELGLHCLDFYLTPGLAIGNLLLYPHPVREETAFTYVLSTPAEVEVEIYTLSGRLVRRLGPLEQPAGFQQVAWDGRSADGQRLASGTYLYSLSARWGDQQVIHRGPLVVVR